MYKVEKVCKQLRKCPKSWETIRNCGQRAAVKNWISAENVLKHDWQHQIDILFQVYHLCNRNGGGITFECPEGTRFQQRTMVCDHSYSVNCSDAYKFFDGNLRIGHRNVNLLDDIVEGDLLVYGSILYACLSKCPWIKQKEFLSFCRLSFVKAKKYTIFERNQRIHIYQIQTIG